MNVRYLQISKGIGPIGVNPHEIHNKEKYNNKNDYWYIKKDDNIKHKLIGLIFPGEKIKKYEFINGDIYDYRKSNIKIIIHNPRIQTNCFLFS